MPILVMKVLEATPHPNADTLRVYRFGGAGLETIQVVANLSNVYEVGAHVAVAGVGSELRDGTKIRSARLRGIDSFGMALGPYAAELGTDVSAEFGAASSPTRDADFVSWPSIELLHNVRASVRAAAELRQEPLPKIRYRCKVKLDGTNAGVQVRADGTVVAQSRSQVLTGDSDNMGFGAWVYKNSEYFAALQANAPLVVFGEWCGQGVQKRAAISQIDRKIFVVFAIQYGYGSATPARLEVDPERIRASLPAHPDVFVLPWLAESFELDFSDDARLVSAAERISALVERVEASDPWVAEVFQVHGLGEGVVLYPEVDGALVADRGRLAELIFKAKGEKHQSVRQKKPAQIEPEVAASIEAFAALVVTEGRLEQACVEACKGKLETATLGPFLKWLTRDVQKECTAELQAASLTWEQVNKSVTNRARSWFMAQLRGPLA